MPEDGIDHAFLCGPGGLIEDGKAALTRAGVPAERIHVEYFSADGSPVAAQGGVPGRADAQEATVDIVLNGTHHAIAGARRRDHRRRRPARRAGDALFVPRRHVLHLPRQGDRRAKSRMDTNYSLEPWELEAGYVLTCQSHPVTAKVVLDYDQV